MEAQKSITELEQARDVAWAAWRAEVAISVAAQHARNETRHAADAARETWRAARAMSEAARQTWRAANDAARAAWDAQS